MSMFWKPASSLPATSAGSHAPDQAKPVAQRGASLQAWWTCARTWRHLWHTVQRLRLRQRMWLEGANSPRPHPLPAAKNYTSNKKIAPLRVTCCKGLLDCGLMGSKTLKQSAFQVQVTNTFKVFPRARAWSVKGCMRIWNSFSSLPCLCSKWNCSRSSRTQQLNWVDHWLGYVIEKSFQ